MSDTKKELKRDNTMQVTAKEGIKLLRDAGEHALLEWQGLQRQPTALKATEEPENVDDDGVLSGGDEDVEQPSISPSAKKPRLQRLSTMAVTAKEGRQFIEEQQRKMQAADVPQTETKIVKPKLAKYTTMLQTKQEGEAFLAMQADKKTNNQQKDEEQDEANEEPAEKKLKANSEKAVNEVDNKKPATKRVSTLLRTAKEGEELLKEMGHKDDEPDSERRRTRSQTRSGGTPTSPPGKKTAGVDNGGGRRGRKGRTHKDHTDDDKSASSESEDAADKKKEVSDTDTATETTATEAVEDKEVKDVVKDQPEKATPAVVVAVAVAEAPSTDEAKSNDETPKPNDKN